MLTLLATAALLGLASGGAAALLRALPWPKRWKRRKPLGCPTCSAGWASFAVLAVAGFADVVPRTLPSEALYGLVWLVMTGVGALVNAVALPPPFEIPGTDDGVGP